MQWVPHDDGFELRTAISREEFAVADAELGEMDWASIDPQPVRKSGGVRHGFTPAAYYWQRSGEHIWCESQQERWELLWLDYSAQLDLVWSQPMIINFGFDSKLAGDSHVPDFFALTTDGDYSLWDVRPLAQVTEHARLQFDETARVCRRMGWHYEVLSGHHPRASRNLNCIAASRHDRCRPTTAIEQLLIEAARHGETRSALCAIASPDYPPLAAAWVDNLAWRRLLTVDLTSPVRNDTIYTSVIERWTQDA